MWKKVAESKELIIFENALKDHKLKIEARKKETGWEVFHTKVKGDNSSLLSEFSLDTKNQVKDLIEKLKKNVAPISKIGDNKAISLYMKRAYKEDFVEKWVFYVGENRATNIVIVKYGATISCELILDERFAYLEKAITSQIEDRLNLKEDSQGIEYNIFYYKRHSTVKKETEPEYNFVGMDFNFDGDEFSSP